MLTAAVPDIICLDRDDDFAETMAKSVGKGAP